MAPRVQATAEGRRLLASVRRTAGRYGLFSGEKRLLVGVSGGADSVTLLYLLHALRGEHGLELVVAHLDHGIRGKSAREDAAFVGRLASSLRLAFETQRSNVPGLAASRGISVEMAAREARYGFFARVGKKTGIGAVAVAHTADDQAETVLLKLVRGAGARGLGGIHYKHDAAGMTVIRPLLDVRRSEIVAFLDAQSLAWREDETNRETSYLRNRTRHEIIPMLEERLNPAAKTALVKAACLLRDEDAWLNSLSKGMLASCRAGAGDDELTAEDLLLLPVAAQRRILRQWLVECGVPPETLNFEAVERIVGLAGRKGSGAAQMSGGWTARVRYGRLSVHEGEQESPQAFRARIRIPGETVLPAQGLRVVTAFSEKVVKERPPGAGRLPAVGSVDRARIGRRRVVVRSWRPADRMRPFGLRGSRKVQDIFVDDKLPRGLRALVPIFECAGEIIWIPGYRIACGWEVPAGSGTCLRVAVERI